MHSEPSPRWTRFVVVGVLLVAGALAWITWQALRLEVREQRAQTQAKFQESLRLALWRMDSAMTPIIAREAARPYFEYQPFYPADRAMRSLREPATRDDILVPSQLLGTKDPVIRLHFEVASGGAISSPQAPQGWSRAIAQSTYATAYDLRAADEVLAQLRSWMQPGSGLASKPGTQRDEPSVQDDGDALAKKPKQATTNSVEALRRKQRMRRMCGATASSAKRLREKRRSSASPPVLRKRVKRPRASLMQPLLRENRMRRRASRQRA
jgi:hypothetical protein